MLQAQNPKIQDPIATRGNQFKDQEKSTKIKTIKKEIKLLGKRSSSHMKIKSSIMENELVIEKISTNHVAKANQVKYSL